MLAMCAAATSWPAARPIRWIWSAPSRTYRGLRKTHLQHVATAAALNVHRLADWLDGVPRAATRRPRFAALAT
jgi:hypothetical protein